MPETYRELNAGFSTADAEQPEIEYRDSDLIVQFLDWRDKLVRIRFPFTVAFRWQDDSVLPSNVRADETYEVINSCWLAELGKLRATDAQHRHYRFYFNAAGDLDVVSHTLEMLA